MGPIALRVTLLSGLAWGWSFSAGSEPRLITTTGDAEIRVVPDEVILTLGVETWDPDLSVAKHQNDARVERVLAVTADFGIEPKHVQTDHISIEPRYRDGYEKRDFIGYSVRRTVVVTLGDISRFDDLLTDVLAAEVNYVHGIQFRDTKLREHRDEARSLGIRAAKEKAVALAEQLGQKVASLIRFRRTPQDGGPATTRGGGGDGIRRWPKTSSKRPADPTHRTAVWR